MAERRLWVSLFRCVLSSGLLVFCHLRRALRFSWTSSLMCSGILWVSWIVFFFSGVDNHAASWIRVVRCWTTSSNSAFSFRLSGYRIGKNVIVVVYSTWVLRKCWRHRSEKTVKCLSLNKFIYFANVSELIFTPFIIKCHCTSATKWPHTDLRTLRLQQIH